MKKLTVDLDDVEVKVIRFYDKDPYDGFTDIPGREVVDIKSELDEIEAIREAKPIAFMKQPGGSYLLIVKKKGT